MQVAAALLKELNPDVEGSHLEASPESLLAAPGALAPYSLVVATQCTGACVIVLMQGMGPSSHSLLMTPSPQLPPLEAFLGQLAGACAAAGVPLLVARSYGMIGYLR